MPTPTLPVTQFSLEYPRSVGVYNDYLQARQVMDYLSDQQFPAHNIALVGKVTRDFTAASQIMATRYEVLVEHSVAEQARHLLTAMPAARP